MKRYWLPLFIAILFTLNVYGQENPVMRPGEFRIDFMPQLNLIANSPVSGWAVTNIRRDKVFGKNASQNENFVSSHGEYFFTDLWYMPIKGLTFNFGFEFALNYADTFYTPINIEHSIQQNYENSYTKEELDKGLDFDKLMKRLKIWKGKAEYKNTFLTTKISTGYGHSSWEAFGDLFGFYPEQWDTDSYRRISGRPAPTSFEADWNISFKDKNYGKLSLVTGPEPIWGYDWSTYAKYTIRIKSWTPTILFKDEKINWGLPDEHIISGAITSRYFGLRRIPLEGGILFQPFHVNKGYVTTTPTSSGNGYGTSDYAISSNTTGTIDALGFKVKANTALFAPTINKLTLTYTYLGKIAGNMNKIDMEIEKSIRPCYSLYWQNIYRQPVEKSEVMILEGLNPLQPGPPFTEPRGRDAAFWVNSQNRQAVISSLFFIYDPVPGQWIYKYYPNIPELWNLNTAKKTPFAFIFNYKMTYYPGTCDLEPYKNSLDEVIWPGEYDSTTVGRLPNPIPSGAWPMKRPTHLVTMIAEFNVFRTGMLILLLKVGEDVAPSAIAYTSHTFELLPVTKMFNSTVSFVKYPFQATLEYGHNVWGGEQWYKDLGATIDDVYKAAFKYNINKNNELQISYIGTRETDNQYFVPKLAPYDEFQLSYKGKFTGRVDIAGLFKSKKKKKAKPAADTDLENDLLGGEPTK